MEIDSIDPKLAHELSSIQTAPQDAKPRAFSRLLDKLLTSFSPDGLQQNLSAYLTALVGGESFSSSDQLSIVATRPLLDDFIAKLKTLHLR